MISVVIPSWNGKALLADCLPSLYAQTYTDFEIIVVDNGSEDGTVDWLKTNHPGVIPVVLEKNTGFTGGVNAGISVARGELIVLLNNDTVTDPTWLESLDRAAAANPEYSLFTSKVLLMHDRVRLDTAGDGFTIAGFGYKIGWMERDGSKFSSPQQVFGASGCAAMYRRVVFDTIGLFDVDFFAFAEDLDISFRALLAGFKCLFVPDARVYHQVRATAPSSLTLKLYYRNLIWLVYKNFPLPLLLISIPNVVLNWIIALIGGLRHGSAVYILDGIYQGLRGLPSRRHIRLKTLKNRKVSSAEILKILDLNWLQVHYILHRRAKTSAHPG